MSLSAHQKTQTAIQGGLWLTVGLLFTTFVGYPFLQAGEKISSLAAFTYVIAATFFAGILAAVSAIIALRMDYAGGKFHLEPAETEQASTLPPQMRPYWLIPLVQVIIQGIAIAVILAVIVFALFPEGLSKVLFVAVTTIFMCAQAVVTVLRNAKKEFLKGVGNKVTQPMAFNRYIWQEHVLGGALINFGINALVAYVMRHNCKKFPFAEVAFEHMVIDIIVTCTVVSLLTALTSEMLGKGDAFFKQTPGPAKRPASVPPLIVHIIVFIVAGALLGAITVGIIKVLGIEALTVWPFAIIKGGSSAVAAAVGASLAGYWSISKNLA